MSKNVERRSFLSTIVLAGLSAISAVLNLGMMSETPSKHVRRIGGKTKLHENGKTEELCACDLKNGYCDTVCYYQGIHQ